MKLTPHFDRYEFSCPCCGRDTVDVKLMQILNALRKHFNEPVTINSGFRCPSYNKDIGGSKNSQHMEGKAADISVRNVLPYNVYKYLCDTYPDNHGFGYYDTFTHVDSRDEKARW